MANLPGGIKTKEEERVVKKLNGVPGIGLLGKDQGNNETENDKRGGDLGRKGQAAAADKRPETNEANPKVAQIKNDQGDEIDEDQFAENTVVFIDLPGLRKLLPIEPVRRFEHAFGKPEGLEDKGKAFDPPQTRKNKHQAKQTNTNGQTDLAAQKQGQERKDKGINFYLNQ